MTENPKSCRVLLKKVPVKYNIGDVKKLLKPLVRPKGVNILKRGIFVVYFQTENKKLQFLDNIESLVKLGIDVFDYSEDLWINDTEESGKKASSAFPKLAENESKNLIMDTGRLFLRNLSFRTTESDLTKLFSPFGQITDINLPFDPSLKRNKGIGFVTFMFPQDAFAAFKKLDKINFNERLLHILPSKESPSTDNSVTDRSANTQFMSTFQRKYLFDLKEKSSVAYNWNALFVNTDAVATYLSHRFNVSKEEIYSGKNNKISSSNVLITQGQAALVTDLKNYLQDSGVDLSLLEEPSVITKRDKSQADSCLTKRVLSGTTFLLKNLPVGTDSEQVLTLIKTKIPNYDETVHKPKTLICPPIGVTAILEFEHSQGAKSAYTSLAYEKYHDNLLMVHWAPEGLLKMHSKNQNEIGGKSNRTTATDSELVTMPTHDEMRLILEENIAMRNEIDAEKVRVKSEDDEKVSKLSKDYGRKTALKRKAQESKVEENEFSVITEPAEALPTEAPKKKSKLDMDPVSTLHIKNIPFQANEEELKQLFSPSGDLIDVRMPKKPAGGHRGFAFIEFVNTAAARKAMETFSETHFLGRRLRIEYLKKSK
ncbi:hypothetical protein Ciccas_000306 [Cichlidogyrus casuarinus]|uniref:RRM domain-containing protein n=1 Tax=Cichlidogyrus casuarinus TaxID=1844966 RepID=A0ABD2QNM4_9PLAT